LFLNIAPQFEDSLQLSFQCSEYSYNSFSDHRYGEQLLVIMANAFQPPDPELIAAKTPFDIVSFFLRAGGIADNSPEAAAIETLLDRTYLEESQQRKTVQDQAKERAFTSTHKLSQHLQDLVEWQAKQIAKIETQRLRDQQRILEFEAEATRADGDRPHKRQRSSNDGIIGEPELKAYLNMVVDNVASGNILMERIVELEESAGKTSRSVNSRKDALAECRERVKSLQNQVADFTAGYQIDTKGDDDTVVALQLRNDQVSQLNRDIAALEAENRQLNTRVDLLENEEDDYISQIHELEEQNYIRQSEGRDYGIPYWESKFGSSSTGDDEGSNQDERPEYGTTPQSSSDDDEGSDLDEHFYPWSGTMLQPPSRGGDEGTQLEDLRRFAISPHELQKLRAQVKDLQAQLSSQHEDPLQSPTLGLIQIARQARAQLDAQVRELKAERTARRTPTTSAQEEGDALISLGLMKQTYLTATLAAMRQQKRSANLAEEDLEEAASALRENMVLMARVSHEQQIRIARLHELDGKTGGGALQTSYDELKQVQSALAASEATVNILSRRNSPSYISESAVHALLAEIEELKAKMHAQPAPSEEEFDMRIMDHGDNDDEDDRHAEIEDLNSKIAALKQEVDNLNDQRRNDEMELITLRGDRSGENKNMRLLRHLISQLRTQITQLQEQLAACKSFIEIWLG
jgi:cell division protein FtsB